LLLRSNAIILLFSLILTSSLFYAHPLSTPSVVRTASKTAIPDAMTSFDEMKEKVHDTLNMRQSELNVTYRGDMSKLKNGLDAIFSRIFTEDNYLHYIIKTYQADYDYNSEKATIQFRFSYWESKKETDYVDQRISGILKGIIYQGMGDEEKEKAIHDWLAQHVKFDDSLKLHSAFAGLSATTQYETVCQGYALLFYKMLSLIGIESRIVEGVADQEDHIWNMVKIKGQWYHVDVTWDRVLAGTSVPRYNYFNVTDRQIAKDHKWTVKYP
jgi:transglutaminase/protease-like cytokinesis protein 3